MNTRSTNMDMDMDMDLLLLLLRPPSDRQRDFARCCCAIACRRLLRRCTPAVRASPQNSRSREYSGS
jgi:hypothetical protein